MSKKAQSEARLSITLPKEVLGQLEDICNLQGGRSVASLIREWVGSRCGFALEELRKLGAK